MLSTHKSLLFFPSVKLCQVILEKLFFIRNVSIVVGYSSLHVRCLAVRICCQTPVTRALLTLFPQLLFRFITATRALCQITRNYLLYNERMIALTFALYGDTFGYSAITKTEHLILT